MSTKKKNKSDNNNNKLSVEGTIDVINTGGHEEKITLMNQRMESLEKLVLTMQSEISDLKCEIEKLKENNNHHHHVKAPEPKSPRSRRSEKGVEEKKIVALAEPKSPRRRSAHLFLEEEKKNSGKKMKQHKKEIQRQEYRKSIIKIGPAKI